MRRLDDILVDVGVFGLNWSPYALVGGDICCPRIRTDLEDLGELSRLKTEF